MNAERREFIPEEGILQEVRAYSDAINRQPEYRRALFELNSNAKPTVELYLEDGVRSSIRVINILERLANPYTKERLLKQLDNGEIPDRWIEELALRDTDSDPYGLLSLERMKKITMRFVEKKIKVDTDPTQRDNILLHAHAVERGADLVINKYRQQLERYGYIDEKFIE